jgi:hypothetical protein
MHRAYVMCVNQQIRPPFFALKQLVDFIINEQSFHNDESCEHITNVTVGRLHRSIWS